VRPVPRANNLNTFMCCLSENSGGLNFVDSERPVEACNGTFLPLPLPLPVVLCIKHATRRSSASQNSL